MKIMHLLKRWREQLTLFSVSSKKAIFISVVSFFLLVGSLLLIPYPTNANLPVVDVTAISQAIMQYQLALQQYETMIKNVDLVKEQIKTVTGHYGLGALVQAVNPWGGVTWRDVNDMVNHGINPGDADQVAAYKRSKQIYTASFPQLDPAFLPSNSRLRNVYSSSYQSAISGMAMGESSYGDLDDQLRELDGLRGRIDHTENLKEAMDLNTAVNVKVAQLTAQLIRMNAVQMNIHANSQNSDTSGMAAQAEFFAN